MRRSLAVHTNRNPTALSQSWPGRVSPGVGRWIDANNSSRMVAWVNVLFNPLTAMVVVANLSLSSLISFFLSLLTFSIASMNATRKWDT